MMPPLPLLFDAVDFRFAASLRRFVIFSATMLLLPPKMLFTTQNAQHAPCRLMLDAAAGCFRRHCRDVATLRAYYCCRYDALPLLMLRLA